MTRIKFFPDNKIINFDKNKTILEIALENDIYIASQCEEGTCSTCMVKIEYGKKLILENDKEFDVDSGNVLACISKLRKETNDEIIVRIYEE